MISERRRSMPFSFTPRPYTGNRDLQPLCELINANYALDWPDRSKSVDDVRRCFIDAPGVDRERDLCLWEDAAGRLVAAARLRARPPAGGVSDARFGWFIEPARRRLGLEEVIHAWGAARLAEIAHGRGESGRLECRA